jgi:GntR family transcriptional regulator
VDERFNGSVLDLLRQKPDVQIAQAVADIVAINADAFLAGKLAVKSRQALLLLEETLFDQEGMAVEFSRNYFVPEFFRFHVVRR